MKTRHKRRFLRSSALRRLTPTVPMITPVLIASALTLSLALLPMAQPAGAQPVPPPQKPHWAALEAGSDLTLRYIYLVLVPQPGATAEEKKTIPAGLFSTLTAEGSSLGLGPTVEAYVKSLKAQGAQKYDVRVIAAGTATAGQDGVYSIQVVPNPDARLYHGAISDSVRLKRTKPGMIQMSHTGQISWVQASNNSNAQPGRNANGWEDIGAPKLDRLIGHTFGHGASIDSKGVIFIYANCVLLGKPVAAK